MHRLTLLCALLLVTACGGDPDPTDAGGRSDGSVPDDAGSDAGVGDAGSDAGASDAGASDAGGDDAGTSGCAGDRPDVTGITGTEGLVIARDGTVYFSQGGAVGRLAPGGAAEPAWVRFAGGGTTVWGLALDAANVMLYVGVPGVGVMEIDTTATLPSATMIVTGGAANGLTIGNDGALYYSDFMAGRVFRLAPGGTPTEVTVSRIPSANGVAFLPDGRLLVASYGAGELIALTLSGGVETSRVTFATSLGNPDGISLDADGNIYVTDNGLAGRLLMLPPTGGASSTELLSGLTRPASLDFGVGPLVACDLYVATAAAVARHEGFVAGSLVPWH